MPAIPCSASSPVYSQPAAHFGKERQVAFSVLQYAARMATKTTPLGYFNTVSAQSLDADPDAYAFRKTLVTPNVALLGSDLYRVICRRRGFSHPACTPESRHSRIRG
ncbi:MAG: hypothetical protein IPM36_23960 [Lewinellaceae bacterium]|nr:hypothetical protein [Lewinellaceae bacterium]